MDRRATIHLCDYCAKTGVLSELLDELKEKRAEVKRLRAALEEINKLLDDTDANYEVAEAHDIARRALKGEED